jgi:glycosyltransferase involved in cell wall biosynthesis
MLCFNDGETVKASVESALELSKYRKVEVAVVDNMSTDGSLDVLRGLKEEGKITLIERRCSRGAGRELGFRATSGEYVLSHMDCDDVFDPEGLDMLLGQYHSGYEGKVMMTQKMGSDEASNITIGPRHLLESLGGWRDLNWGEDWDLWARAAGVGKYAYLPYPVGIPPHRTIKVRYGIYRGARSSFGMRRTKYADAIRSGRRMFKPGEHISASQRLVYYLARTTVALKRNYLQPVPDPDFSEFPTA